MRIGLFGAGRIGTVHATTLCEHPEVAELFIADVEPARAAVLAQRLRGRHSGVQAVGVEEVVAAEPNAIVISATTAAHADLILLAAEAGVPVFCEKPIARDASTAKSAVETATRAGIPLQIGFQRRFDPGYRAARTAVQDGELGALLSVHLVTADPAPPPPEYIRLSGGIFHDMHIHDFDILRWVTGREVVAVQAHGANHGDDYIRAAGDVDTTALLLTLADGTHATASGSRYNGAGYDVRMELAGTAGRLVVGLDERTPLRSAEPGVAWPLGPPWMGFLERFATAWVAELHTFLEVAQGRIPSPCTGEEALEALYVAQAAQQSLAEQRTVEVAEVRVR